MTSPPTVAIVHLGTEGSMGGRRRVASLTELFRAAGAEAVEVALRRDHRVGATDLRSPGVIAVAQGRTVPESLAWSHRSALAALRSLQPAVVVCCTARAYHPALLEGPWTLVLDYVDRLSDSYRDRALIFGGGPTSVAFRILARTARRFERRALPAGVVGVAAGWSDARSLGLDWLPITVELPAAADLATADHEPAHDLLLLGKLSYAPNVEAIERLDRIWPRLVADRPGTTLLLAGAAPTAAVLATAERNGWSVAADFDRLATVMASARVATAPLTYASGIQIKVLEAAAFAKPQVIGRAVANGFAPGLPAAVIDTDDELVAALVRLLDDPEQQRRSGAEARAHVADQYSVDRWVPWALGVLDRAGHRGPPPDPAPIADQAP